MNSTVVHRRPHSRKRNDMPAQIPKFLHLLCTSFLITAFLAVGIGGWALTHDSGGNGANIGAGILMLFGYAVGAVGLVLGLGALVTHTVLGHRGRLRA